MQPIYETAGRTITEKKEIKNMVEAPLVNACEILFDKNIPTFDSSANTENNKKEAWISIIFDELSEENKEIALKNGTFIP
ncbi:hypothetical protein FACS1894176_07920 [Bacteroidia bacterium]|nr:hypothetical protein FACS1894176_07920 [Bacteroidia bacterium]